MNGKPVGQAWIGTYGGGFLFGDVDLKNPGTITSEKAGYIYPGFELAIVGNYQQNFLQSGNALENGYLESSHPNFRTINLNLNFTLAENHSEKINRMVCGQSSRLKEMQIDQKCQHSFYSLLSTHLKSVPALK